LIFAKDYLALNPFL